MRMYDLIEKKKRALELTDAEIRWMIKGYTDDIIPDYQMAAMAMAIRLCGMSAAETASLTDAMAKSGETENAADPAPLIPTSS